MTGRGRPHLPLGAWGTISVTEAPRVDGRGSYVARARYRDADGVTRTVTKRGQTKTRAKAALTAELAQRTERIAPSEVFPASTVEQLSKMWLDANRERWATNTVLRYELASRQINAELGAVKVSELRRSRVGAAIARISEQRGPIAAQSAKKVLSGMCKLAMRHDALTFNPVEDSITIPAKPKKEPRALTPTEIDDLVTRLRAHEKAAAWDLPDFVEFMLGTGARIGEVCAARESTVHLDVATWEIDATAVRVRGVGMVIQPKPKTKSSHRVLALPPFVVDIVHRRLNTARLQHPSGVIFGSPQARAIRDPSNTSGDLRRVLDDLGYDWVSSHTFRKTAATLLDAAGLTGRMVADQLGHAKPSMTADRYMGRRLVGGAAAEILQRPGTSAKDDD